MKKAISYLAVLASLLWLFSSCAKESLTDNAAEEVLDEEIPEGYTKLQISLTSESTRTSVTDAGIVTWTNGDKIEFLYSSGTKKATVSSSSGSASVSAILPESGDLYAVYPAGSGSLSGSAITFDISNKPSASFSAANYSVAKVNRGTGVATFCNVTALLKVDVSTLTGISRIQVESPSGASLGGSYDVTFSGYTAQAGECLDGSNILYVDVDGPGVYYIPVAPGVTHSQGLSFLYFHNDGGSYNQIGAYFYENEITTAINRIYNFGAAFPVGGNYYVSVNGSGNKSGFDADNAMTFERFKQKVTAYPSGTENERARINQTKALDGATFHFAAGTYSFPDTTPLIIGSYQSATNLDITLQGVSGTIFDGAGTGSIIKVNSMVDLTINDIEFAHAQVSSTNEGGALHMSNSSSTVEINGCSFTDNVYPGGSESGSGVTVTAGKVTMNECNFSGNAAHAGGALNINGSNAEIEAVDCTFSENETGPAVRVNSGTATFTGCTFENNIHTNKSNHGSLLCQTNSTVNIYGCTFSGNSAREGGAIELPNSGATLTIGDNGSTHTIFDGNKAADYYGGAINAIRNTPGENTIIVTNAVFAGNNSKGRGGAIAANGTNSITLTGCTFESNSSTEGEGGAINIEGNASLSSTSCTFTGNSSSSYGGSLNDESEGTVFVNNCIFDGNTAPTNGVQINVTQSASFVGCTIENTNSDKGAFRITGGNVGITGGTIQNNVNTSENNHGALNISGSSTVVTISGVDFYNNSSKSGGALYVTSGAEVDIQDNGTTHTTFRENKATSYRGGAFFCKGAFTINATNAVFTSNNAKQSGGAISDQESTGTINLTGCSFDSNSCSGKFTTSSVSGYAGGTLAFVSNTNVTMTNCDVTGSTAKNWGSTLAILPGRTSGTFTIEGGSFHNNGGTSTSGGVIFSTTTAPVICNNVTFSNNNADWGGVFAFPPSVSTNITCTGCTFDTNYGEQYGGVVYSSGSGVDITFSNCKFLKNYSKTNSSTSETKKYGGGVWYSNTSGSLGKFDKCYFGNNNGGNHGAVANIDDGTVYFNDCAMYGNYVGYQGGVVLAYYNPGYGNAYMNNCTVSGSYSSNSSNNQNNCWFNVKGTTFFASNCSFLGDGKYNTSTKLTGTGHVCHNDKNTKTYIINCISAGTSSGTCGLHINDSFLTMTPEIYASRFSKTKIGSGYSDPVNTDASYLNGKDYYAATSSFGNLLEETPSPGSEAYNTYYWSWNGTMTGTNNSKATLADVNDKIQTLAPDFYTWLNGLGALGKDQRGNTRGDYTWPGAYDGTNN